MIKINLTRPLNFFNVAARKCRVTHMAHSVSLGQSWTRGFPWSEPTGWISWSWTSLYTCRDVAETNFQNFCQTQSGVDLQ